MFARIKSFYRKNRALFSDPVSYALLGRTLVFRAKMMLGSQKPAFVKNDSVIVISCHHKVMTTYFSMVLRLISLATGKKFEIVGWNAPSPRSKIILSMQSALDVRDSDHHRLVHIMRDPRDMIVSGYHYHKWTYEKWVHRKRDGMSYQERLNSVSQADGLHLEIDHLTDEYGEIWTNWPMGSDHYLEVKFEQLMSDAREEYYTRIFRHLGFDGQLLELATGYMRLFEAGRRTGNASGKTAAKSHIRKAASGQWQKELQHDHRQHIESNLGHVLRKFEYEENPSWAEANQQQAEYMANQKDVADITDN